MNGGPRETLRAALDSSLVSNPWTDIFLTGKNCRFIWLGKWKRDNFSLYTPYVRSVKKPFWLILYQLGTRLSLHIVISSVKSRNKCPARPCEGRTNRWGKTSIFFFQHLKGSKLLKYWFLQEKKLDSPRWLVAIVIENQLKLQRCVSLSLTSFLGPVWWLWSSMKPKLTIDEHISLRGNRIAKPIGSDTTITPCVTSVGVTDEKNTSCC